MFFRYLSAVLLISLSLTAASRRVLRVCADPNNLPFSNQAGEGLENRVAELVAAHLRAELQYVWWAERKSFLRNSLQAGLCDVVMGVPSTLDSVSVTRPYYQSTYVFVERADRHLKIASLNDPRLEQLKIGIHIVGDDYAPPAHLLARRGLASQLAGYRLYGPLGEPNPPSQLIDAVVNRRCRCGHHLGAVCGVFCPASDGQTANYASFTLCLSCGSFHLRHFSRGPKRQYFVAGRD